VSLKPKYIYILIKFNLICLKEKQLKREVEVEHLQKLSLEVEVQDI